MNKKMLRFYLHEISCFVLFPKRYDTPQGMSHEYWRKVSRAYGDERKDVECSDYHWRIIEYDDGREELAYVRSLKGGVFSGMSPALYRGIIIPRRIDIGTFAHIKSIRLAF